MRSTLSRSRHLLLADFEISARKLLPKTLYAYVQGGVEDNLTLHANLQVFDDYFLRPNVLVDVSTRDISVDLFGHRYSAPVGIAPMGIAALTGYRGDLSLAQAAAAANVPFVMSGSSLIRLEEVVDAAPNIWFQSTCRRYSTNCAADRACAQGRCQDLGHYGRHASEGE
ncbi:alpha-hydroxy-acid oxidizing protein [Pseudomonas sp. 3JA]